ncbi:NAD-dependent epimerase/dehydratase family protein [Actinokineospora enzanensis]|uniref:NAD-dependent epimerase/dehydratase family protein n=1 Tax=Actinokineospora enzanensis TaxID=155975 RepID=UPI00036B0FFB|nr:NAD(P)-dependent oxidoreductase [Actinokineospora enzanensis]
MTVRQQPRVDRVPARILLTGATGRVGARFVPLLSKLGATLRMLVWTPEPGPPPVPGGRIVMGDLGDDAVCRAAVEGMDAVVHIASAFQGVDAAGADELNEIATGKLAAAALAAGVRRFVSMSSYLVYEPDPGRVLAEDAPVLAAPSASFPAAKLGAERALSGYADSDLAACVLRVAFTYGERDPHLAEALHWAESADPDDRLHFVHHADVRQGVLTALGADEPVRGTFNLGDDGPTTAAELRSVAADFDIPAGGPGSAAEGLPDLPGAVLSSCALDISKARDVLGFRPAFRNILQARDEGAM